MAKLIEIQNCGVCRYSTFGFGGYKCKHHNNRWMNDTIYPEIPEWCTLYDADIIDKYNYLEND